MAEDEVWQPGTAYKAVISLPVTPVQLTQMAADLHLDKGDRPTYALTAGEHTLPGRWVAIAAFTAGDESWIRLQRTGEA